MPQIADVAPELRVVHARINPGFASRAAFFVL
jgi:hypothetical protein